MLIRKILLRLEHYMKHLSTVLGSFFVLIIGLVLIPLDYVWPLSFTDNNLESFKGMLGVTNVMVSILIGILLTTYSVVFVVMQLASSQFSPRILRYFLEQDLYVHNFIGIFISSIALCLIPQGVFMLTGKILWWSILAAFGWDLLCLLWFYPRMIIHLNENMNVATITSRIKGEVVKEIDMIYPDKWQRGERLVYKRLRPTDDDSKLISVLSSLESGYLDSVDYQRFYHEFEDWRRRFPGLCPQRIFLPTMVGEFVLKNTSPLVVLEWDSAAPQGADAEAISIFFDKAIKSSIGISQFRSYKQDITFGVRKLVDIAIKAISPAVNDPTTCLNCIDYIGEIVRELCVRQFPSHDSRLMRRHNIYINEFNFDEIVDFAFDQIHQWGYKDPIVVKRIIRTIDQILPFTENPFHLKVLIAEVEQIEVERYYNDSNTELTQELKSGVIYALNDFRSEACRCIARLERNGLLGFCEQHLNGNARECDAERSTLEYLRNYVNNNKL